VPAFGRARTSSSFGSTVAALTLMGSAMVGCGGSSTDEAAPAPSVTVAPSASALAESGQPTTAAAQVAVAETLPPGLDELKEGAADRGPICESIPTIDAVRAVIDEPFAAGEETSDPLGDPQECQLFSETAVFVGFTWFSKELGAGMLDELAKQGQIIAFSDPALPEAAAYANSVIVPSDGVYWQVSVVNPFVGSDSPELRDAAAQLLTLWMNNAG
jgi:hypothetical protein